jgi:hypothetical protein
MTPARLIDALADWILLRAGLPGEVGTVVGFDGPGEIGTTDLADKVAEALQAFGRPVIRASTNWWWRPPALRLEFGREDVDMLLTGWVDGQALRRELIDPVHRPGSSYITRLRDPVTGRSIKQPPRMASAPSVLLLDGPFLLAADVPLDAVVGFGVSQATLTRSLGPQRAWWITGFARYDDEYRVLEQADVVLSYDHAAVPAAAGLERIGRVG